MNTFKDFEDFETKIYSDIPILIQFYADWERWKMCDLPEHIDVYKCNIDEQEDIAEYCDITDLPSTVCFRDGKCIFFMEGNNKVKLNGLLEKYSLVGFTNPDK